ncbi:MAG: NAD(P)H-hydrate dehydratase [Gemmatimonadota bacterium]|nr:NAD(P)H-hydrate dehydratase [Gemmatimonadota bacterium]
MIASSDAWSRSAAEVWLPTGPEMAEIDRVAVERGAADERVLIEAAGREIARRISVRWPEGPVCALVGSGHNGADALAAGRTLLAWGRPMRFVLAGSGEPIPDARAGWPIALEPADQFLAAPPSEGVVLDGILGTGAAGPPRPEQARLIDAVNRMRLPVISIDGPSGADMTSGAIRGACVEADLTVCLGWPKFGLLREPARSHCGLIEAVEIGFPPIDPIPASRVITGRWVQTMLQTRSPTAHKGTSGYLLLAAGNRGMAGAAVLAARAADRAGAGIVRILGHPDNREIIQSAVPGAVFESWSDEPGRALAWAHALAIGPGLGVDSKRQQLVAQLLQQRTGQPAIIDADGLNAFQEDPDVLAELLAEGDVMTPHAGEMARLLGCSTPDIVDDPPAAVRQAVARFGCTVVLKGSPTLIGDRNGPTRVAVTGGPALAVGGTGDVLSGAIGGYLAGGYPAPEAASIASLLTGIGATTRGEMVGLVAEDIPDRIPEARRAVEELGSRRSDALLFASDPVRTST